ncbi:MAG TPA: DUF3846 domain-containing protein [Clostridiales bacterium]|nr:DUF3846 domain-containing protein [Clostridiales bacterium]
MNIEIYQINMERDANRIAFMSYDNIARFQGSQNIDCKIYDKVFEGDVECNTLEDVYKKFNLDHSADYKGRSLSVSDVVAVKDTNNLEPGYYFCDDIGFKKVDFHPEECAELENLKDESKITVLVVEPMKKPKLMEIGSSLEEMQAVVGGDIEEYMPFEDDVAIICNEEGKVNGLPLNRAIYGGETHEMMDIIAGTFFIAYAPVESEKFKSLPPKMADKYAQRFKYPETFMKVGGEIKAISVKPPKNKER